jgi:ABC-type uncharacterized transport system permease subunit
MNFNYKSKCINKNFKPLILNFKLIFMKTQKLLSIASFFILSLLLSNVSAQKTNFSGTWVLNEGKSQFGESRFRMGAVKAIVKQDENSISADFTRRRPNGEETTSTEKFTLDGKECTNSNAEQTRVKKSTVTFSEDGKTMTINSTTTFERDGNTMEIKSVEIFKMSEDGKNITVETTSTSQRGEFKATLVYDKTE